MLAKQNTLLTPMRRFECKWFQRFLLPRLVDLLSVLRLLDMVQYTMYWWPSIAPLHVANVDQHMRTLNPSLLDDGHLGEENKSCTYLTLLQQHCYLVTMTAVFATPSSIERNILPPNERIAESVALIQILAIANNRTHFDERSSHNHILCGPDFSSTPSSNHPHPQKV